MRKFFFFISFSFVCAVCFFFVWNKDTQKMNFASCADTEYYSHVVELIGSIHQHHLKQIGEIAIFDLGFTKEEREELEKIAFVKVYDVEKVNEAQLVKCPINPQGKIVRGWFSFKPVIIKQALDLFADVFFLDADLRLKRSMLPLYKKIKKQGYLFFDCGHKIWEMTPQTLIKRLSLDQPNKKKILNQFGISSGIQGLTRDVYSSYVYPVYQYAKDLSYFKDDGTGLFGYGAARHDQTLYSIQVRLLNMDVTGALHTQLKKKKGKIAIDDFFIFSQELPADKSYKQYLIFKKNMINISLLK